MGESKSVLGAGRYWAYHSTYLWSKRMIIFTLTISREQISKINHSFETNVCFDHASREEEEQKDGKESGWSIEASRNLGSLGMMQHLLDGK